MGNTLIKHYFPHDFNARNDDDIEAMLLDYRATGYGLYWGIVERLHEDENSIELNDRFYKAVAKQFMEDPDKVKTFIHDCVVKYFLFELNGDTLTCARVGRNIEKRSSISKERSEAGKAGAIAKKNKAIAEESEANAQQNLANPSKEKKSKVNTHTVECLCSVFGKKYKTPEERLPPETGFFRDIDAQYPKLLEVYKTDQAIIAQVTAYMKHCDQTKRKRIGTAHKLAETIVQSDWIVLTGGNISPPEVTTTAYSAAEKRRQEWTLEGWEDFYKDQLRDNNFRKHFGYGDLRSSTPMGSNSER